MKLHADEMLIIYNDKSDFHKKARAYARSISNHINEVDYDHYKLTRLMWGEILEMLQLKPKKLMNKANPKYQSLIARHDYDPNDWLEILVRNPDLIKAPIAVMNGKAVLCEKPKDIFRLSEDKEPEATRLNDIS